MKPIHDDPAVLAENLEAGGERPAKPRAGARHPTRMLTLFTVKGGAAKTTLSINIADGLGRRGLRVVVIDMDPAGGSRMWWQGARDAKKKLQFDVVAAAKVEELVAQIQQLGNSGLYDYVIADCEPGGETVRSATSLWCSDMTLIPFAPIGLHGWQLKRSASFVSNARERNPSLSAHFVAVQVHPRNHDRAVLEMIRKSAKLPVLRTEISYLEAFRTASTFHWTVYSDRHGQKARQQIDKLIDEIGAVVGDQRLQKAAIAPEAQAVGIASVVSAQPEGAPLR